MEEILEMSKKELEYYKFCEEYIVIHKNKFSKEPLSTFDAHRP